MQDLRFLHLGQHNIASFARKADAVAFAKASGKWGSGDVFKAYNRFCIFWVIGEALPTMGELRLLMRDGATVTIPFSRAEAA